MLELSEMKNFPITRTTNNLFNFVFIQGIYMGQLCGVRGNGTMSLTFGILSKYEISLSTPMPNPPVGDPPYLRNSKYQFKLSSNSSVSSLLLRTS